MHPIPVSEKKSPRHPESKVISGMGPALGQALAGFVGSSAGWRAPFALVGAGGLVM